MGEKPPPEAKTGVRAKPISSLVLRAEGSNGVPWRGGRTGAQTNVDFFGGRRTVRPREGVEMGSVFARGWRPDEAPRRGLIKVPGGRRGCPPAETEKNAPLREPTPIFDQNVSFASGIFVTCFSGWECDQKGRGTCACRFGALPTPGRVFLGWVHRRDIFCLRSLAS